MPFAVADQAELLAAARRDRAVAVDIQTGGRDLESEFLAGLEEAATGTTEPSPEEVVSC